MITAPFKPRSFESTCFSVTSSAVTIVILLIYRLGSCNVTNDFFNELVKYLESLALYKCQIIVAGDFSIHVENPSDPDSKQLGEVLSSFLCTQHVPPTATHTRGGTLDLVITKSDQSVEELQVDPPGILSEHSLISMPIQRQPPIIHQREVRSCSKVDRDEFRTALLSSDLCSIDQRPSTAAGYFDLYHDVLQSLADHFAPVRKTTKRRQRLAPWMDDKCRLRRQSQRLERIYRRTKSAADRQAWVEHERTRHRVYRQKECAYWSAEITLKSGQPKKLWSTFKSILGSDQSAKLPRSCPSAQQFIDFFNEKVEAVRRSTAGGTAQTMLMHTDVSFSTFERCTIDDIKRTIMSAPAKSCALDPLPTTVMKEFLPELLPFLTDLCNSSLTQGCLPVSQRHALSLIHI